MRDHGPERQGMVGSRPFSFFHFFIVPIDCFPGVIAKWVKHITGNLGIKQVNKMPENSSSHTMHDLTTCSGNDI